MGTLLWWSFVEAMQSPLMAVAKAKNMLTKINFPREAILMGGMYMVGFNFLIRMALPMAVWRVVPGATLVVFPFAMLGLLLCGFAIDLALVPNDGLYGDISRGIPLIASFWMILTPVDYPARSEGLAVSNSISPLTTTVGESLTDQHLEQMALADFVTVISLFVTLVDLYFV